MQHQTETSNTTSSGGELTRPSYADPIEPAPAPAPGDTDVATAEQPPVPSWSSWWHSAAQSLANVSTQVLHVIELDAHPDPPAEHQHVDSVNPDPSTSAAHSDALSTTTSSDACYPITSELLEFASELAQHDDTFVRFPRSFACGGSGVNHDDTAADADADVDVDAEAVAVAAALSPAQERHAQLLLEQCPAFARLRFRLCPAQMSDLDFWRVYFVLLENAVRRRAAVRAQRGGGGGGDGGGGGPSSTSAMSSSASSSSSVASASSLLHSAASRLLATLDASLDRLDESIESTLSASSASSPSSSSSSFSSSWTLGHALQSFISELRADAEHALTTLAPLDSSDDPARDRGDDEGDGDDERDALTAEELAMRQQALDDVDRMCGVLPPSATATRTDSNDSNNLLDDDADEEEEAESTHNMPIRTPSPASSRSRDTPGSTPSSTLQLTVDSATRHSRPTRAFLRLRADAETLNSGISDELARAVAVAAAAEGSASLSSSLSPLPPTLSLRHASLDDSDVTTAAAVRASDDDAHDASAGSAHPSTTTMSDEHAVVCDEEQRDELP